MPDPRWFRILLVDALRLAALPVDRQVAALPSFVHVPDEVALVFDDAWDLVPQVVDAGLMTPAQHEPVAALDDLFNEMSDAADADDLWTIESMRTDPRWERARALARDALGRLGEPEGDPAFEGITWIGKDGS